MDQASVDLTGLELLIKAGLLDWVRLVRLSQIT